LGSVTTCAQETLPYTEGGGSPGGSGVVPFTHEWK
jgi:hypothetical protein